MPWRDDSTTFGTLTEHGRQIASVESRAGQWRYLIEQSVIPHRSPATRTIGQGFGSRLAAQIAAEDHIESVRASRRTNTPAEPDNDDLHRLVEFDVLKHTGTWR